MSRGPGKWQRAILDALKTDEYVCLCGLAKGRSQRFAYRRAAQRLAQKGLVTIEVGDIVVSVTCRENSPRVSHLGAT
jgi:hypothetical protein